MNKFLVLSAVIFLTSCATNTTNNNATKSAGPSADEIKASEALVPKEIYRKVLPAIYEVVVPRPDETGIVYEKPLPVDRAPYRFRNDKYFSIGTAFATGPNEFVSAAHVFPIYLKSYASEFFIRDQDGKVYSVDKVLRYSTYRDLISFSVKKPPTNNVVLAISKQPEVGDSVFVIGNAQGEGISLRSGQVSSFTPEEVDNKWKFIRFSAPASPGNSGGPLLDSHGEVVGVVTRKNISENLNFAIPIEEFSKLSKDKAEFIIRDHKVQRENQIVTNTWQYHASLPVEISFLSEHAQKSLKTATNTIVETMFNPKDERFFPANKDFQEFTRSQYVQTGISELTPPAFGREWATKLYKLKRVKLVGKEWASYYGQKNNYVFYLSKSDNTGLAEFNTNSKLIFEQALKAIAIYRNYFGEKVRVYSLGDPKETTQWKDDVGRTWIEGSWEVPAMDVAVEQNCSPTPHGAMCALNLYPLEGATIDVKTLIKKSLSYFTWSYDASISEWKTFLKEDKDVLPDMFKDYSIVDGEKSLKIKFGKRQLSFQGDYSGDSDINIRTRYSAQEKTKAEIANVTLRPDKDKDIYVSASQLLEPRKPSAYNFHFWAEAKDGTKKFDGKSHKDGKGLVVYIPSKPNKKSGVSYINFLACYDESGTGDSDKLSDFCQDVAKTNTNVE
jgi:S1-C subfamily serine protease